MAEYEGGLDTPEKLRAELKLTVDYIPEERLSEALIYLDNLLEFNEETQRDLIEAMNIDNLLGPYESFDEMIQDALTYEEDEENQNIQCTNVKAV
ncbi:MAG: hypothetical protein II964_06070 [Synergistaceae bacterium]|nr:hypothetical protein [Synergistaceae bacterium]